MSTHKRIMLMQVLTAAFFSIHYLLIGGFTACVLNAVAVIRNMVFYHKDKKIFQGNYITIIFCIVMAGLGIFSWNAWFSVFFVVGMFFNTLSFSFTNPQATRKMLFIASPLLLIYDIFAFSIGGMVTEFLSIISCIAAFIRYKKQPKIK